MMNKFFMRRFRTYFLFMMIPSIIVLIITLNSMDKQIGKELKLQANNTLTNVNTNLDYVISNVIYQNSILTYNSGMNISLKKLLSESGLTYSDAIYLRNIQTMLQSVTQSYSYVDSIYLYLDQYEKMFTSDEGVVALNNYYDDSWKTVYDSMNEEEDSFVSAREVQKGTLDDAHGVISFYQRFLLQKGVIVVNINVKDYKKILKSTFPENYENLYLFNENGDILISWNERLVNDDKYIQAAWQAGKNHTNNVWAKVGGERYLFNTDFNSSYGITMVSMISYEAKLHSLIRVAEGYLLIFVLNCFVVMVIAYFSTMRIFKQIKYMIHVFDEAERGVYPKEPRRMMKDEYDIIMNNIIYLFLNTVQLNSRLKEKEFEQQLSELTALQLQINPHFLYNTLQSMELEIMKNSGNSSEATMCIQNLSDILKYSLGNPLDLVTLQEEINYLKEYVEIQKYRFGDKFIVYYEIEEGLETAKVFRLMLQPLVENSILHGIRKIDKKGYIKVKAFRKNNRILFHVIDTGIGMKSKEIEELNRRLYDKNAPSIGLRNINSRLLLRYGEDSYLKIQSKMNYGTCITFQIPYDEV